MRLLLAPSLVLLLAGCVAESAPEAGRRTQPTVKSRPTLGSQLTPEATTKSGYVLSKLRRGCGSADGVVVIGRLDGPPGLLDFVGVTVELRAAGVTLGSSTLEAPDFTVSPQNHPELPDLVDVRAVDQGEKVLAEQTAVDLRPGPICG